MACRKLCRFPNEGLVSTPANCVKMIRDFRGEDRTMAKKEAIEAIVSGNDQQVGFRALVMKQAIEYNLAGLARNDANQVVHFTLQGDKKRIHSALATIKKGPQGHLTSKLQRHLR
jgi:acylphosphatase